MNKLNCRVKRVFTLVVTDNPFKLKHYTLWEI